MRNRRSRRRGAGRGSQLFYYLMIGGLVLAAVGVLAVSVVPSLAFSAVGLDRPGNIGVVDDSNGVVGLDVNSPITAGSRERLVTVTNNLDVDADITVSLNDGSQGTLFYDGSTVGDSHTVPDVNSTDSVEFDIEGTLSGSNDWESSDCSTPEETARTGGWEVTFYCVKYDSKQDETTYKYSVSPVNSPSHDLSHIVFGFADSFDPYVESTSPDAEDEDGPDQGDIKTDPVTSVYGLKFEKQISKTGSEKTYMFTIRGDHGTTSEGHGLKFGPKSATVNLPGPAATSDSPPDGETIVFSVTSSSLELTATIERSTKLEAAATATPTDTATGTSTPTNQPPTADFTSNRRGNSPKVELDASASSDPDGSIVSYQWDVGADGSIDHTGKKVTAKISKGTQVKLIVTDNDDSSDSTIQTGS